MYQAAQVEQHRSAALLATHQEQVVRVGGTLAVVGLLLLGIFGMVIGTIRTSHHQHESRLALAVGFSAFAVLLVGGIGVVIYTIGQNNPQFAAMASKEEEKAAHRFGGMGGGGDKGREMKEALNIQPEEKFLKDIEEKRTVPEANLGQLKVQAQLKVQEMKEPVKLADDIHPKADFLAAGDRLRVKEVGNALQAELPPARDFLPQPLSFPASEEAVRRPR